MAGRGAHYSVTRSRPSTAKGQRRNALREGAGAPGSEHHHSRKEKSGQVSDEQKRPLDKKMPSDEKINYRDGVCIGVG